MALKIPEAKLWRGDEGAAVTGARLPAAQGRPGSRVERPCSPQVLLLWCSVPSPASHCCCFRPCSHLPLPWSLPQLPGLLPSLQSSLFQFTRHAVWRAMAPTANPSSHSITFRMASSLQLDMCLFLTFHYVLHTPSTSASSSFRLSEHSFHCGLARPLH